LAKYGIAFEDVRAALASANANSPIGAIEDNGRQFQIYTNDQATRAADYTPLIIAYRNGAPVHLTDVAEVLDSPLSHRCVHPDPSDERHYWPAVSRIRFDALNRHPHITVLVLNLNADDVFAVFETRGAHQAKPTRFQSIRPNSTWLRANRWLGFAPFCRGNGCIVHDRLASMSICSKSCRKAFSRSKTRASSLAPFRPTRRSRLRPCGKSSRRLRDCAS
jgi:AcrB/AcrD/AcrF family